jgi:Uma2 family endonuclease
MAIAPKKRWTVEEYLEFERSSELRHEFLDGEVFAMVGASQEHNLISTNTVTHLHSQLRRPPCRIYASDMRVKVRSTGLYAYPDIVVTCEEPLLEDSAKDTLLNPALIIEILSPSTERYDRGLKFQHYRAIETLQEYVLIAQDAPRVERFARTSPGQWLLSEAVGLDSSIELASIGCVLRLADVYEQVSFGDSAAG